MQDAQAPSGPICATDAPICRRRGLVGRRSTREHTKLKSTTLLCMKIPAEPRVIIRSCREYDPGTIRTIIREGLEELGLRPFGRTLVKPNLVCAGELFPHAHTRPEFGEGVLRALRDVGEGSMTELAVGERCGITIPTRLVFDQSGFDAMMARVPGVKRYLFEEVPQVEIPLSHPQRLRDYVFTPEPVARADFFV